MLKRCAWVTEDSLYIKYHDEEWGVPVYEDQRIFEFLVLESAQAGLSWITVLKKRENYRRLFANFDPRKVAKFNEKKVQSLLLDPGIIRNELKIRAAINNAQRFLEVQKEFGSFSKYMWGFVDHKPLDGRRKTMRSVPTKTAISDAFAKDLKSRGFRFLGSTTLYAHMQAVGMVNDHLTSCHCYHKTSKLGRKQGAL